MHRILNAIRYIWFRDKLVKPIVFYLLTNRCYVYPGTSCMTETVAKSKIH